MASAYILINTDVGAEQEVLDQLKSMPEVTEAAAVYGIYDIVCRIESDTMEKLKETMIANLRSVARIRSTMTMICVSDEEEN